MVGSNRVSGTFLGSKMTWKFQSSSSLYTFGLFWFVFASLLVQSQTQQQRFSIPVITQQSQTTQGQFQTQVQPPIQSRQGQPPQSTLSPSSNIQQFPSSPPGTQILDTNAGNANDTLSSTTTVQPFSNLDITKPMLLQFSSSHVFNGHPSSPNSAVIGGQHLFSHLSRFHIWFLTSKILPTLEETRGKPDYVFFMQPQLLKGIPAHNMSQILLTGATLPNPTVFKSLIEQSSGMLSSQQSVLIQRLKSRLTEPFILRAIMASENPSELIEKINPRILFKSMGGIIKVFSDSTDQGISSSQIKLLPETFLTTWIDWVRTMGRVTRWTVDDLIGKSMFGATHRINLAILGFSCKDFESMSPGEVVRGVEVYRKELFELGKINRELTFPVDMRNCVLSKILEYLRMKNETTADENILKSLKTVEINVIGGEILTSIPPEALVNIPVDTRQNIIEEIAHVDTLELFNLIPLNQIQWYANTLLEDLHSNNSTADMVILKPPQILQKMGNLLCYSSNLFDESDSNSAGTTLQEILKERIYPGDKTCCLSNSMRVKWSGMLKKTFGEDTSSWSPEDLNFIGDLLITLEAEDLSKISTESMSKAGLHSIPSQFNEEIKMVGESTPVTFVKTCVSILGSDGPDFYASYKRLMRRVLEGAQFMVNNVQQVDEIMMSQMNLPGNVRIRREAAAEAAAEASQQQQQTTTMTSQSSAPTRMTMTPTTSQQSASSSGRAMVSPPVAVGKSTATTPNNNPSPTTTSAQQQQQQQQQFSPPMNPSRFQVGRPVSSTSQQQQQGSAQPTRPQVAAPATTTASQTTNQQQPATQPPMDSSSSSSNQQQLRDVQPSPSPSPSPQSQPILQAPSQPQQQQNSQLTALPSVAQQNFAPPTATAVSSSQLQNSPSQNVQPAPAPVASRGQITPPTSFRVAPSGTRSPAPSVANTRMKPPRIPVRVINPPLVPGTGTGTIAPGPTDQGQGPISGPTRGPGQDVVEGALPVESRALANDTSAANQTDVETRDVFRVSLPDFVDTQNQMNFTCRGIKASGAAAIGLTFEDLDNLPDSELFECVEVLGLIDWDVETKAQILKLFHDKLHLETSRMNSLLLIELGNLVQGFSAISSGDDGGWSGLENSGSSSDSSNSELEIWQANLTVPNCLDMLSILGSQISDPFTLKSLAAKFHSLNQNSGTFAPGKRGTSRPEHLRVTAASLGNILCGLEDGPLRNLLSADASLFLDTSPMLGKLEGCNVETLETLAEFAVRASNYGPPSTWTRQDLMTLGVIIAGLKPEHIDSIQPDSIVGIQPSAIKAMPPSTFQKFTPEQISKLSYYAAISVQSSQMDALTHEQNSALKKVIVVTSDDFKIPAEFSIDLPEVVIPVDIQPKSLNESDQPESGIGGRAKGQDGEDLAIIVITEEANVNGTDSTNLNGTEINDSPVLKDGDSTDAPVTPAQEKDTASSAMRLLDHGTKFVFVVILIVLFSN